MSHYVECKTEFHDADALVASLVECGFEESQIEIHTEAVPLYGYQGDVRQQKANIVIRRQHVGSGANDVGWKFQSNGAIRAIVSEFDAGSGAYSNRRSTARFNQAMQDRIKQEYAYQIISRQQRARGRSVSRQRLPDGEIEVVIEGYR